MARAKYKLGTFVKTTETEETAAHYGAVEEIRTTVDGTSYKLTGLDDAVVESDIEQGYRPIVTRKTTAKGSTKVRAKKRATAETHAQA